MPFNIAIILFSLLAFNCYADNEDCSKIKRSTDDKGVTTYSSPDLKHLRFIRQYSTDTFTGILFHLKSEVSPNEIKSVTIVFDDGTEVTQGEVELKIQQQGAMLTGTNDNSASAAYSSGYLISFYIPITNTNQQTFSTKQLRKVVIDRIPFSIPSKEAEKTIGYLDCLVRTTP